MQIRSVKHDIIKNINQETWLQRRKKVVKAAVDGMSDGSISKFQKYVAVFTGRQMVSLCYDSAFS